MFMVDHVCTRCHMKRITKQDLYRSGRRLRSAGIGRKDAIRLLPLCRTCCTLVMSARLGLRANGSGHGMSKTPPGMSGDADPGAGHIRVVGGRGRAPP